MHENKMQAQTIFAPQASHNVSDLTNGERRTLHPSTLQMVSTLLSGKRVNGGDVLLTLLEYAVPGTSEDVAVVEIKSVQQFSAQPQWPWGYTTTCKILLVLEALGILERCHHHDVVELRLHLGPPERDLSQICQALDELLQRKTSKVQRLAARVKEMLQQGNGFIRNEFPVAHRTADLQPVTNCLERLLEAHGVQIPLSGRQELAQASQTIAHLLCPSISSASSERGNVGNLLSPKISRGNMQGEREAEQREFFASVGIPDSLSGHSQGNLEQPMNAAELSAEASIGNSSSEGASEFPKLPKNSPVEEQKGNSSFSTTFNVSCNSISEEETNGNVMRQENPFGEQEGNLLAMAVEGHVANAEAYRYYLAHYDPRTVLATFIYIKQRQYDPKCRPIASLGAYFDTVLKAWSAFGPYEAACEAYQRACTQVEGGKRIRKRRLLPGIPAEVQELVNNFWGWSYDEIVTTLQRSSTDDPLFGWDVYSERGKPQTAHWLGAQNQLPEPRSAPNQWMDRDEALCLIERIGREAPTISNLSLQLAPEPRPYCPQGTSQTVYLVDVVIERIPVVYAEPAQWHTYYHNVQACFSL